MLIDTLKPGHVGDDGEFYIATVREMVAAGILDPKASTLVLCAGILDYAVLMFSGFSNVTLSNLGAQERDYAPYAWQSIDAEAISLPDGAFEQVIVHAGLHHCRSPHAGLCEMYRVAAKTAVVFEARDSALMRLAERFGATKNYEVQSVRKNGGSRGGLRDGPIPNFIYRWTEREVWKALAACDPTGEPNVSYYYGFRIPVAAHSKNSSGVRRAVLLLASAAAKVASRLLPRQGNEFAFAVGKPVQRFSWLT